MKPRATGPAASGAGTFLTRVAFGTLSLTLTALLGAGCSRRETAGSRAPAPAPTATVEREETPAIREAAVPGRPPFEGLSEPRDGAVDRLGRVWIADFGHSRIKIFDGEGGFLGGWGGRGNGTWGFRDPCGIAIRGDEVYVADTWNGRVQHFTLSGEWKGSATGFFGARGVAVGPDGRVWVTDTGNHKVRTHDAALSASTTFGKQGSGPGEFSSPVGIAVGANGNVYVADTGNRRIVVLAADGTFTKAWPLDAWDRPAEPHVEVGGDGSLYVTDPGTGAAVLRLGADGRLLDRLTSGPDGRRFVQPTGLAIDPAEGVLYVVNRGNNTVSRLPLGPSGKS